MLGIDHSGTFRRNLRRNLTPDTETGIGSWSEEAFDAKCQQIRIGGQVLRWHFNILLILFDVLGAPDTIRTCDLCLRRANKPRFLIRMRRIRD
jgi:hypothetical protein